MTVPATAQDIAYVPYRPADQDAYLAFARQVWPNKMQSQPNRLRWLLEENPWSEQARDALLAWASDKVVGSIFLMRLPWRIGGERIVIAAAHDLMVLPDYRHGLGTVLVTKALAQEQHLLLAGSSPAADRMYQRLSCPDLSVVGYRRITNWWALARGLVRHRSVGRLAVPSSTSLELTLDGWQATVTATPSEQSLAAAVALQPARQAYVDWDVATLRWRFFGSAAPAALLVSIADGRRMVAWAVLGPTLRRGCPKATVLQLTAADDANLPRIFALLEETARRLGLGLLHVVANDTAALRAVDGRGWQQRPAPSARWHSRGHELNVLPDHLWAGNWV